MLFIEIQEKNRLEDLDRQQQKEDNQYHIFYQQNHHHQENSLSHQ